MQEEAFDVISQDTDTMIFSNTGSGKTLAFLLPILSDLDQKLQRTQAMIIAPTRELALQITSVAKSLALGFNIQCCYGGHPVRIEKKSLESNPELIVGTPGRLQDHLDRENIDPLSIKYLVLDEFDKTLEMGFHKQMESIIRHFRFKPQYILTSATRGLEVPKFVPLYQTQHIDYAQQEVIEGLHLSKVLSPEKDKIETLVSLLWDIGNRTTFIFCNFRDAVERISQFLTERKIENDFLHGGLDQLQRENTLSKFRNGTTRILVTTDLAGRGLDIPQVENVIHYHIPITGEIYTHRNGRTARMGAEGNAYVLISQFEDLPEYIPAIDETFEVSKEQRVIRPSKWTTVHINKGKRDKINKVDVVGFLSKKGNLDKGQLGLVELKEAYALAAVKKSKAEKLIKQTNQQKIKGKKAIVRLL